MNNITEIEPGHQCYKIDDIPSSVAAGSNATIQLAYWANYEDENAGNNETFYACADVVSLTLSFSFLSLSASWFSIPSLFDHSPRCPNDPIYTFQLQTSTVMRNVLSSQHSTLLRRQILTFKSRASMYQPIPLTRPPPRHHRQPPSPPLCPRLAIPAPFPRVPLPELPWALSSGLWPSLVLPPLPS